MFNKPMFVVKKICCVFLITNIFLSCAVEAKLIFRAHYLSKTEHAIIDINYPKAEGSDVVAHRINEVIEGYIARQIDMSTDSVSNLSLDQAIKQFDDEYRSFKITFPESAQKWEALIDSEVTYESSDLVSIAVNTYLDTGGAHGNSYIEFLNFDPLTGNLLKLTDLINNIEDFTTLVESYYIKETEVDATEEHLENAFFGKGFQLPESIGYSDDGIIILYNTYEIASYAQGILEFTIPYEDVTHLLKLNSIL